MRKQSDMLKYCSNWYESLSGQSSLLALEDICTDIMSEVFGYYAIETGVLSGHYNLLQHSRIAAGFSLVDKNTAEIIKGEIDNKNYSVLSTPEQLPVSTDNIDLVVASHVLESSKNPHQILREIDRVLVPEGHCVLIGFNPFALSHAGAHIGKYLRSGFKRESHHYKMHSVHRIHDWFSLLGFDVVDVNYLGFRPSVKNKKIFEGLAWMDNVGSYMGPIMGSMYVVHAKKRVIAMRPDKKVWMAPAVLSGGKVALNRTAQRVRRENFYNQ
ncbi:MAG: methyltransferase domain-containing protein [Cocleimonas sp.]